MQLQPKFRNLLESTDKKLQLIPENSLDKLILKSFLAAKVGGYSLLIPTPKKLIVGRVDFEKVEFDAGGIAETFIQVEPYNMNFYHRLYSKQYKIQFWLGKQSNFFGNRINTHWQIDRSTISINNQQGMLPRLPIITLTNE